MPRKTESDHHASEATARIHTGAVPIFGHEDYRGYLREIVRVFGEERGFRSRMAAAAGCTPSLLSQVLGDEASFSLDHLYRISQFLGLSEPEWNYLRELALIEKCSTAGARRDVERKAKDMRRQYGAGVFFSAPAVTYDSDHMLMAAFSLKHWDVFHLIGVPAQSTPECFAKRLGLSIDEVQTVLEDWLRVGLVEELDDGSWACRASRFSGQPQVMSMVATMYKIRALNRVFAGGPAPAMRWAAVRLKSEDIDEVQSRIDDLLRFVWKRADERQKDGDKLMFLSFDVERL